MRPYGHVVPLRRTDAGTTDAPDAEGWDGRVEGTKPVRVELWTPVGMGRRETKGRRRKTPVVGSLKELKDVGVSYEGGAELERRVERWGFRRLLRMHRLIPRGVHRGTGGR